MLNQDVAWLGALLPLVGFGSYIWDMSHGRAEPNRVSWAMWAAAPLIAFHAELAQHTRLQATLVVLALGLGPLAVLIVSLSRPECYWKLTRSDRVCGILSAAALELWLGTRRGELAIAFAVAADGLAAVPTIRKSWSHPRSESPLTYLASGGGAVLTLLTIRHLTFTAVAFPAYVAAVSAVIAFLVLVPRRVPLSAGRRAAAAAALRRSGLAATISVALTAATIAGMEMTNTLAVPVIPPGLAPPAAAAAVIGARPAYTTSRQPGTRHHRRRHHDHAGLPGILPQPGSPASPTASLSAPPPSLTRPRTSAPPSPTLTRPYSTTTSPATPSPTSPPLPPSPPPTANPSPSPTAPASPTPAPGLAQASEACAA